jgi:signal transduction histidine kinase
VTKREIDERTDGQLAVEVSTPNHQIADARGKHEAASERRALRSLVLSIGDSQPMQARRPPRAPASVPLANDRRRLERDLHDGVQNELVALIVKLALAQQDPETPPALVEMLAGLEARAQAALDSVRNIARGIYPPLLADFGLAEALRAQAARAAVDVRLMGSAPRGTEAAEEAVYFAGSEAIQNAAKYAGRGTQVTLRLRHDQGSLAVRIADDGRGFDPAHTPEGAGVQNIRDRIEDLGGTFEVVSSPGHGTVLTISLPWPAAADGRR